MSADDATREAKRDLARLNYPPDNWVIPRAGPAGAPMRDVLVVGGGMIGQTVAFALRAEGVGDVRVIDRAAPGHEGPWVTFARMPTLRSPKHVNGPDLGIPSLTYRAWFEAQFGAAAWEALGKIDRASWHDYLAWVRGITGVAIENGTALAVLALDAGAVRATLALPGGAREEVHARQVVLCLGRGAEGRRLPDLPSIAAAAASGRVWHASDDIDFARLRGARVAVVGAGASAFDNAGTALEAGAAQVTLFARLPALPRVNYFRGLAARPWPRGYARLAPRARWDLFVALAMARIPPPVESVRRCEAFANFAARLGESLVDLAPAEGGALTLTTSAGASAWDAVILCTGFDRSPLDRPELAGIAPLARAWEDEVGPVAAAAAPVFARHPFLGPAYELLPRPGAASHAAALARVHVLDWSSMLSLGPRGGDIPGLELGATRLAEAIAGDLFEEDAPAYRARLLAFDDGELGGTRLGAEAMRRAES